MINIKSFTKKLLVVSLFLLSGKMGIAQTESYIQSLTGVIKPKDICVTVDEKFAKPELWSAIKKNVTVQNLVTFEVRFDTNINFFNKPFDCELVADIMYKDSARQEKKLNDIKLRIHFDTAKGKTYKGIAYYKFSGGHEVTVTVKSIASKEIDVTKAAFLRLKNQILIDRTYKKRQADDSAPITVSFGNGVKSEVAKFTGSPNSDFSGTHDYHKMHICWASELFEYDRFDLEYTFYDAKSLLASQYFSTGNITQAVLEEAFKNNCTRVSVDDPEYELNLVYPKGFLLVRIRAYTYVEADGEMDREEFPWHYVDLLHGTSGFAVYSIQEHLCEPINNIHFKLNWQYSAAFAEEGKKKEVVSYFDGGMKSRQSVTLSNSDNVSIVAENILDKQNRPAVNILPVPTDDNTLRFFPRFNRNQGGDIYSYADFNSGSCASNAFAMSTSFGSSKYYSSNNPFAGNSNYPNAQDIAKDIPDAAGFPFAVTEFTNDQTGRIRRQGGVGPTFQLGSGHETSYYYGKPSQEELDRLFGSEAGAAAHYNKNMVVDANGQVSISYVDISGKTVATALAGTSPGNLKPLESANNATTTIRDELIRPQGIVRDINNMKVSFSTTVLVPAAATYNFTYEFAGRSLEMIFGFNPEKKICADCYYDVKFSISDECGAPVQLNFNGNNYPELLVQAAFNYGNSNGVNPNTQCGIVLPTQTGLIHAAFPKTGEYKVSYELVMSKKALDYYMDYLKQAQVIKTPDEFRLDYLKNIDLTGCFSDCRDCEEKLGTLEAFEARMKKILEDEDHITITSDIIEWIHLLYAKSLADCGHAKEVGKNCTVTDGCAAQRKEMLKDVTPGGQYMLYDETTLLFKERGINVFVSKIKDNTAVTDEVLITRNGVEVKVPLRTLKEVEVITQWKPEWAYLMLKQHPEYCLLAECEWQTASKLRDQKIIQTDDEVEARNTYSWKREQANFEDFVNAEVALILSPYNQTRIGDGIRDKVHNFLVNVPVKTSSGVANGNVTLNQFIRFMIYCDQKPAEDPTTHQFAFIDLTCPASITCDKPLEEWRLFRNIYIAIKQQVLRDPLNKSTSESCKNCYIGVNAFSSIYNEKAEPNYYPQLKDFIILPNSTNTGLVLKYNKETPINNLCDVYIVKATSGSSGIVATPVATVRFLENGSNVLPIPLISFDINEKDLYFVEHITNNYHHNIDGIAPNTSCPNNSDFTVNVYYEDGPVNVDYVGTHPLLTQTVVHVRIHRYSNSGGAVWGEADVTFDPLQTHFVEQLFPQTRTEDHYVMWLTCHPSPASCPMDALWPSYFQKKRRFYESSGAEDIQSVLEDNGAGSTPMGTSDFHQNAEDMSQGWMEKLKAGFTPVAPSTEPQSDLRWEPLRQALITVCVKGSDLSHPFGASSVKPAEVAGAVDISFQAAIIRIMGTETPACNHFLIDYPLPYGSAPLENDQIATKLSECGYNLLTRFKNEWIAAGGTATPPNPLWPTLKEYINKKYDPNFYLTDAQITELLATYISGCPVKRPFRIPALLTRCTNPQTPTCLKCSHLYNVQVQFHSLYPQFPETLPNYYELLAGYINEIYQMNVSPSAVYAAIEKCKSDGVFDDGCDSRCEEVITGLHNFYQVMPLQEYFDKVVCEELDCSSQIDVFRVHITTWLNITLGATHDFEYYYEHYFTQCAIEDYFEPSCWQFQKYKEQHAKQQQAKQQNTKEQHIDGWESCTCPSPNIVKCCDIYPPLQTFNSIYTDNVDPRLLAYFFQLRRYTVCSPTNLPNISYLASYSTLVSYFNNLVPSVVPNCDQGGHGQGLCSPLWSEFNFAEHPAYNCPDIYDPVFLPGEFVLCSQPLTPIVQSDPDDCLKSTVHTTLANFEYAYNEYVKNFLRDYREAYFAKCTSITPSLVMEGTQQEYHYTLYYYDQSGNLVKTIPPKGVTYLTPTEIEEAGRLRDEDNGECYKNSAAPVFNGTNQSLSVPAALYPSHKDGPLTLESWVKFSNTNTKQVILNQFDDAGTTPPLGVAPGKAGYYAYIENGKLYFRIFGRSTETWVHKELQWLYPDLLTQGVYAHLYNDMGTLTRYREFKASCNTKNLITSSGSSSNFYHIVFQFSGNTDDQEPVKIYVNGILQTLDWTSGYLNHFVDNLTNVATTENPAIDQTIYEQVSVQIPFSTASSTPLIAGSLSRTVDGTAFNGISGGSMKQLRIYNSAPDAADLRRNSYDGCFMPATKSGLALWLPLNRATNNKTEDIQSGDNADITADWPNPATPQYPHHKMPTYYAYNSLNQVIHQETPDAGQSNFWYDRLGRLVASQNAEQKKPSVSDISERYSYTIYDAQGRIAEVGEKTGAADITTVAISVPQYLDAWLHSGIDRQVTQTIYDEPDPTVTTDANILLGQLRHYNSRKRVVTSVYRENKTNDPAAYNFATHYIYDISGNVNRLYQENKQLPNGHDVGRIKTLDYEFDLISGKVNQVWYQKEKQDQYLYRYEYDADNKLHYAWSGRDIATLRYDARYQYHLHGPLARTELGHDIVQGIDYAYTLQGWMKGINGLYLNDPGSQNNFDLGGDGVAGTNTALIPADVYGYTLGYYNNDYSPIDDRGGQHPISRSQFGFLTAGGPAGPTTGYELFNGNIAYTTYANRALFEHDLNPNPLLPFTYSYQYDQLNRLAEMRNHYSIAPGDSWGATTVRSDEYFAESVTYDPNGNILHYNRNGWGPQVASYPPPPNMLDMDHLEYHYKDPDNNNKLDWVGDNVDPGNYSDDIDGQSQPNYEYDRIGNLIKDRSGDNPIREIRWTVYGKIKSIEKQDGTLIEYGYDPSGNRISKTLTIGGPPNPAVTTYYFRDATGNTMAVYEEGSSRDVGPWTWKEQDLYGSSRLGIWMPDMQITDDGGGGICPTCPIYCVPCVAQYDARNGITAENQGSSLIVHKNPDPGANLGGIEIEPFPTGGYDETIIGTRHYELTNHLGNVMSTITDLKTGVDVDNDNTIDYYIADVVTANDYYPFGMQMPGRKYDAGSGYRYGFNGKEDDKDINGGGQDYGMRVYDVRLGKFLSVDPVSKNYPQLTPYQFASNKPINGVDLDGLEWILKIYDPQALTDFVIALNSHDIYKARGIAFKAIHSEFDEADFMSRVKKYPNVIATMSINPKTEKYMGGELVYDKKAPPGVTLRAETNPTSTGGSTVHTLHWDKGTGKHYDDSYPVDVRAFNSPDHKDFYGSYDFVGTFTSFFGSATYGGGGGWVSGYMKGYGRVVYSQSYYGPSTPGAGMETGSITGNFKIQDYSPSTLAGFGASQGWGAGIAGTGSIYSFSNETDQTNFNTGNATFAGEYNAVSFAISLKKLKGFSFSKLFSRSTLVNPIYTNNSTPAPTFTPRKLN